MKKYLLGLLTGITAVLCVELAGYAVADYFCQGIGVYLGTDNAVLGEDTTKTLSKMGLLKGKIEKYFMNEVEDQDIEDGIYKGMLEGLGDPYSCYYTKEEYDALMEDSSGVYCGIGATVMQNSETGAIYIINAFDGGAAKEAGLSTGDMIYKVEGEEVAGEDLSEVVAKMKGEEGTKVNIEVYLYEKNEYKEYTLERRQIEVPTVSYEMKEENIGYIAVNAFDEPTDEQFVDAMEQLKKQGMKGVIVDLRNNGGGMLESVVNMLDYLLPKGKVIVSTKDKDGKGETYTAKSNTECEIPMVILINGNTASASEVFSGALQDYDKATLVGTTSFGKGIVQSVMALGDGSAIKITTSKYFTPKGRNIHGTGIEPDIMVESSGDSKTDKQYKEAYSLMKQRIK